MDLKPKCRVTTCDEEVHLIGDRFCELCATHHSGGQPALFRGTFNEPVNDPLKGWHQPTPETFTIIRDTFPAEGK